MYIILTQDLIQQLKVKLENKPRIHSVTKSESTEECAVCFEQVNVIRGVF